MAYQILVVDDEPALRMMVQEILTRAGYAVCLAGSCREALTQRAQVHPDAILLDVMLPDGDGFSLLGQLRRVGGPGAALSGCRGSQCRKASAP